MARRSQLSDDQCAEIGRRYEAHDPVPTIALAFGVSSATVYLALGRAGIVRTNKRPPRMRKPTEGELAESRQWGGPTSWDLAPRPPRRPHRIEDISFAREWVRCTCGTELDAVPDVLIHDRHQPLVDAWQDHRRAVGERPLSVAQDAMLHRAYS